MFVFAVLFDTVHYTCLTMQINFKPVAGSQAPVDQLEHDLWTLRDDGQASLLNDSGGAESLPVLPGTVVLTQAGPSASEILGLGIIFTPSFKNT